KKIKRQDGGQPLANAQVKLLNWAVFWWQEEAKQSTNVNGEFRFENLKSIYNENGIPTGPVRGLKVTKYGFRDTTAAVKSGAILKPGESWSTEILMQPESKVIGKIVNEKGSGISAMITVIGGESGEAIPPFFFILPSFNRPPASFELRAPKGYNKVVIDPLPYDNTYLKDTINIFISGNSYDMGTIVVKKALHRVKIFAGDQTKAGGDFFYITAKLPGAKIRLETKDGVLIGEKTADQAGFAEFAFSNIETQYKVTVSAPEGLDFESKQVMINNFESKDWKTYYILLKPAAQISGFVYVGSKNQPVANAHIRIKGSSSGIIPEAYSDASGHYVLHNVPVGKHIFTASKKTSNLIGDETGIVNVPAGGLQEVNFSLQVYSEMDITHLMGFPIEVNDLTESGNDVIISGMFVDLDSLDNNLFRSTQTNLSFTNVAIEPDPNLTSVIFGVTVPVAKPKVLPLKTDDNKLDIKIFSNYSGSVNDNKIGIELSGSQSGSGVIKGKVLVSKGSFNVPSQQLNFEEDGFYLLLPNSQEPKLPVITADKSNPAITSKFTSVNSTGGKIKFSLWQFESEASASGSFLYKDSLVLNTTIHTNIEGVIPPDLNLAVGNIKITQNS
ncbi:MAG: carboxypeptidase regulatory-like domain-containing protein, partial [Bacteroidetes bacterium]|nr:carboxypeptidase regulatory-like domain-containing protein [Bacteroidota bacterium]